MPSKEFRTWNYKAIAKHFYAKYAHIAPEQLKQELTQVVISIIHITEQEFFTCNLDKTAVWSCC